MDITAYIINLNHRKDRYEHITNEIQKLSLKNYEIVDAIVDETKTCFASHLKCVRLAKDNNLPYVLILEDDAIFTNNCNDVLDVSFNEIQKLEWDMLYLGANPHSPALSINSSLLKLSGAHTTHAYMVHEKFYDTILNLKLDTEIDVCYSNLMLNNNVYMCDPMIAYQLPSYSDLQDGFRDYNEAMHNNYLKHKIK